mmetsp:Transcript_67292/g.217222  ORF Transcript_67292/g.217222 Transcript_67292/m.217222 type:complete len:261 (+) Transcript_67292:504-1286(+)
MGHHPGHFVFPVVLGMAPNQCCSPAHLVPLALVLVHLRLPCFHRRHQALARCEADAILVSHHWEVDNVFQLKRLLHKRQGRFGRQYGLVRQSVTEVPCHNAVHCVRQLRREEWDLLSHYLLLIKATLVDELVEEKGDSYTHHQRWHEVQVVGATCDENDDCHRHLLKSAEHGRTANHGVDTRDGNAAAAPFPDEATHDAASQAANEHRAGEVAGGHRDTREADVQHRVREESQQLVRPLNVFRVSRGEERLHCSIRRGEQ